MSSTWPTVEEWEAEGFEDGRAGEGAWTMFSDPDCAEAVAYSKAWRAGTRARLEAESEDEDEHEAE